MQILSPVRLVLKCGMDGIDDAEFLGCCLWAVAQQSAV